jgi:hypothetical protein
MPKVARKKAVMNREGDRPPRDRMNWRARSRTSWSFGKPSIRSAKYTSIVTERSEDCCGDKAQPPSEGDWVSRKNFVRRGIEEA